MNGLYAKNDDIIEMVFNDPNYKVKSDGTVWTRKNKNGAGLMKNNQWREVGWKDKNGYWNFNYKNRKIRQHRFVYRALKGKLDPNLTIDHVDNNPSNNHPNNLDLVTQGENNKRSYRKNPSRKKPRHNTGITMQIAELIRKDSKNGLGYGVLVKKYGLSKSTISYIVSGRTWKDE